MLRSINSTAALRAALDTDKPVVVDFSAPEWCVPCRKFAPHYEKAAANLPDVEFILVDIDRDDTMPIEFDVQSVPTVRLYRSGESVDLTERSVVRFTKEVTDHLV